MLKHLVPFFNNQGKSDDCLHQSSDSLNAYKTKVSEVKRTRTHQGGAFKKRVGRNSGKTA
jgi:hypothetical protein